MQARPLEQYPDEEHDMARYMRDSGMLATLGIPDTDPLPPDVVNAALTAGGGGPGALPASGAGSEWLNESGMLDNPDGVLMSSNRHLKQEPTLGKPGSKYSALHSVKLIAPQDVPLDQQMKCHPLCHCQKHQLVQ